LPAPKDELEPTTTATDTVVEPTEIDDTPAYDPMTEGLEEEIDDAPAPAEPDAPEIPEGVTADAEGRWRTADGKFSAKQPNEAAKASVEAAMAPPPPPPEEPPRTWTANLYGAEKQPFGDGALYKPGVGVLIREEHVGRLQQMIAHAEKYPDLQTLRQERAKERETFASRETFAGEKFGEVLHQTLLSPDWMTWATSSPENYQTAQMQVRLQLEKAQLESTQKFGPLPTTTPAETSSEGELDRYEAQQAFDSYVTELLAHPSYQGVLSAADKPYIVQALRETDVPLFHNTAEGWQLDERPIAMVAKLRADAIRAARTTTKEQPKAEAVTRRNDAAVPKPTAPAIPAPKPKDKAKPVDKYAEKPWENPDLDFRERKTLFNKAKGFSLPGR